MLKRKLILVTAASFLFPSLLLAWPRYKNPVTPDQVYQNDLDLQQDLNKRFGVNSTDIFGHIMIGTNTINSTLYNMVIQTVLNNWAIQVLGPGSKYLRIGAGDPEIGSSGASLNLRTLTADDINIRVNTNVGNGVLVAHGDAGTSAFTIHGTNTNDNASTGYVGESVRSLVTRANGVTATTSSQWFNITTLSLTSGDWLVTGIVTINANGGTITANTSSMALSTSSGNVTTDHVSGDNVIDYNGTTPSALTDGTVVCPNYRLSISGATTVYLKTIVGYSAGTPKGSGRISAVRIR